jgi:hypothetical protein
LHRCIIASHGVTHCLLVLSAARARTHCVEQLPADARPISKSAAQSAASRALERHDLARVLFLLGKRRGTFSPLACLMSGILKHGGMCHVGEQAVTAS